MTAEALEAGYWRAYRDFYRWGSIFRGAWAKDGWGERLRHVAYAGGWKKLEPLWGLVIRAKRVANTLPMLEAILSGFGQHASQRKMRDLVEDDAVRSLLARPASGGHVPAHL